MGPQEHWEMPRIQGCACVCVRVHTRVCLQLTVSLYFFLLSLCPVFLCVCLSSSLSIHASAFLGPPGLSNFPFAALTFPLISLLSPPSLPAPRSPSYSSHNHWVTLLHLRPSFLFLLSSFPVPSLCLAFISLYSISLFSPSSRPPFLFSSAAPPHLSSSTPTASSSHICHLLLFVKAGSVLGGWWITHIGGLNQIKLQLNYTNKPIKRHSKSNFHSIPHIYCESCFSIILPSLVPSLDLSLFFSLSLLPLSSPPPDPFSLPLRQAFTHPAAHPASPTWESKYVLGS